MTKEKKVKTAPTAAAKGSKTKKQTLGEFRAWLSGVEEMQADDWAPDFTQWKRIRAKIDEIVEGRSFNSSGTGSLDEDEQPVRQFRTAGPSGFGGEARPSMPAHYAPPTPPPFMNTNGTAGARVTTPTIDTSDGNYASSLE